MTVEYYTGSDVWGANSGIYSTAPAPLKNRVTFHYYLKGTLR